MAEKVMTIKSPIPKLAIKMITDKDLLFRETWCQPYIILVFSFYKSTYSKMKFLKDLTLFQGDPRKEDTVF